MSSTAAHLNFSRQGAEMLPCLLLQYEKKGRSCRRSEPPNGKRAAPSPRNSQLVELFLVLPQGVFEWDSASKLIPVPGGDERNRFHARSFWSGCRGSFSIPLRSVSRSVKAF